MKKKLFFEIIFLILAIIAGFLLFFHKKSIHVTTPANTFSYDTATALRLSKQAAKIKKANPDSAIYFYLKAIRCLQSGKISNEQAARILGNSYAEVADLYSNKGNYIDAIKYDSLALILAHKYKNTSLEALGNNIKGVIYYNQGNYPEAMNHYEKAMALAKKSNDKELQIKIYTNIGIVNFLLGDQNKAVQTFLTTIGYAKELKNDELISGSYVNLGMIYYYTGRYEESIKNYTNALSYYRKQNDKSGMAICYQNMGDIFYSTGDFGKALGMFQESLRFSKEAGDKPNIARAHHNLGEVYSRLGDFQTANSEYIESVKIKEQTGDLKGTAADYISIGILHYQHKNYQKALPYLNKALAINEKIDYVKGKATAYASIAHVYAEEKKNELAINYFRKSLAINQSIGDKSAISDDYVNLGIAFRQAKDFRNSEEYLLRVIELKKELAEREGIAIAYNELALLYLDKAKLLNSSAGNSCYGKAVENGLKAYKIANEIRALPIINSSAMILKEAYNGLKNFSQSLIYSDRYISTNDSLYNKAKTEAITYAEAKWNAEKKQVEIDRLTVQKKLNQEIINRKNAENKQQRMIIYAIALILAMSLATSVVIISFIRKRRDVLYQKQLNNIAALKMQNTRNVISPHFVFNALSSISGLVNNPDKLKEKISELSFLLRKILENMERTAIPLSEELEVVKAYLSLQQERMPEPFHVEFNIPDNIDIQQLIPAMIIQIPVENAIKHGLMPKSGLKSLRINIINTPSGFKLSIEDNGIGLSGSVNRTTGTGTGLKVLMQTIYLLNSKNKQKIEFSINDRKATNDEETKGTIVEIFIPSVYSFNI